MLPLNEKKFHIDLVGETTGEHYKGDFVCTCVLNIGQKHQLEVEIARLMADLKNPTPQLSVMSDLLANISVRTTDAPEWWTRSVSGLDLLDENLIVGIYDALMEAETEWRSTVKSQGQAAKHSNDTAAAASAETPAQSPTIPSIPNTPQK